MGMEGGQMNKVPSDEDFARANRVMQERFRNLSIVEENIVQRFERRCPLAKFVLLPHDERSFEAYVFFETDKDIDACKRSGVTQEIIEAVYEELERAGRGTRPGITVRFGWDSHENVVINYDGDYLLRLR
jgi:hypothetical protein